MRRISLLRPDIALPLGAEFLYWYLREPVAILRRSFLWSRAFNEILSLSFLLRTLLKPWKNIVEKSKARGLSALGSAIAMNMISRCIGAIIRIAAIFLSLALQIGLFAFTVAYLALWILYPIVLLFVAIHLFTTLMP